MTNAVKLAAFLQKVFHPATRLSVAYWDSFMGFRERPLTSFFWNIEADFGWCPFLVCGTEIHELKYDSTVVWSKTVDRSCDEVYTLCRRLDEGDDKPSGQCESTLLTSQPVMKDTTTHLHPQGISDVFWFRQGRPNFFICQRVTSPDFSKPARMVQDKFCAEDPAFQEFLYTPQMFHLTLCTLSLPSCAQVAECFDFLADYCERIKYSVPVFSVSMVGVGSFNERVLYAAVEPNRVLSNFVKKLKQALLAEGFSCDGECNFVPHITLLKFNKRRQSLRVKASSMAEFGTLKFGELNLDQLHLCLMGASRDDEGFYRSFGSVQFHPDL